MIPVQQARIAEIVGAWEAWLEVGEADEKAGVTATEETIDRIVEEMRSLAKAIAAMRATTLAGMRVRASILAAVLDDDADEDAATDELMIHALVRDLLATDV